MLTGIPSRFVPATSYLFRFINQKSATDSKELVVTRGVFLVRTQNMLVDISSGILQTCTSHFASLDHNLRGKSLVWTWWISQFVSRASLEDFTSELSYQYFYYVIYSNYQRILSCWFSFCPCVPTHNLNQILTTDKQIHQISNTLQVFGQPKNVQHPKSGVGRMIQIREPRKTPIPPISDRIC